MKYIKFFNNYEVMKSSESHSIRDEYIKSSPDEYYSTKRSEYKNPHLDRINKCLDYVYNKIDIGYFLDLACGDGIVSEYLSNKGLNEFKGSDPYFKEIYENKFNRKCYDYRFEDIAKNGINDKFNTVICSYALHLCNKSYMNNLLYNISNMCEYFVVISPSKYPIINEHYFKLIDSKIIDRTHIRIYKK